MDARPSKRVKLSPEPHSPASELADPVSLRAKRAAFLSSISRSISPPAPFRSGTATPQPADATTVSLKTDTTISTERSKPPNEHASKHVAAGDAADTEGIPAKIKPITQAKLIQSPFKLTKIHDLPPSENTDTVSLHDILGNPLIKEAWVFNYCFDVDWLMNFFDSDVRTQIKVKVIHGSWQNENPNKLGIDDACRRWENVEAATAYLPNRFGTHHSKMFILFTHDDLAQVVIHTANMLAQDWTNMTQAAWISPMLPLLKENTGSVVGNVGSGSRFKHDLQAYLAGYGSRTKSLRAQLAQFDFNSVRGALIASIPSHMEKYPSQDDRKPLWDQKLWGYPSLIRALDTILPQQQTTPSPHVVCQVSSIATLPATWQNQFFAGLCRSPSPSSPSQKWDSSRISIIYPTPGNVASSLNGYSSGGSIHMKAQSPAHQKQISKLRDSLCQWTQGPQEKSRAGRHEAAPHIKTFVSFSSKPTKENPVQDIQWALLTSANLSQQAWGTLPATAKEKDEEKEVVVQSYEIGVLVWPELYVEDFDTGDGETKERSGPAKRRSDETVRMIPVFGKDTPSSSSPSCNRGTSPQADTIVGLRLPYDLPLTHYGTNDMPWSPQGIYNQPDRFGRVWPRSFH